MTQSAVYQAAHVPQNQSAAPDAKPYSIYEDILNRTNGDLYIGVVGPVRTGKSTFITTFMEKLVLPLLPPSPRLDRMQDELPQSASGRSIMTTQPKFIPGEGACDIDLGGHVHARVRMVDSVGYLIPGALEKEESRMVSTPWEDAPIPFEKKHAKYLNGQALHAKKLSFVHPKTNERVVFECPLPKEFEALLEILKMQIDG